MQSDTYGPVWQPTVAIDSTWRPYCDQGHWIYTDSGWYWQSDYPWGDIVFHYGRWCRLGTGWAWVPGYDWAPAWVCWRRSDLYCGWAPLPPSAVFKVGVGLTFHGGVVVDGDFGLTAGAFTFVAYDHFWDHDVRAFVLPRDRVDVIFPGTFVLNGYRMDHGRFIVDGLGRDWMARYTHHDIRVETPVFHDYHDVGRPGDAFRRDNRFDDRGRMDDHSRFDDHHQDR